MAERTRVAVLIGGRGSNMAALLYASRADDCPFEIVAVGSNRADAAGLRLAEAEGAPTFSVPHAGLTREAHDAAIDAELRRAGAQVVALAGYMRLLTSSFVESWAGRLVNIHPSLLPKYKGLDTHARALAAGDRQAGCSVHLVTEEVDSGALLGQVPVAILPGDTPDTLAERVRIAEHQLFPSVLARFVARERDPAWIAAKVGALALALPRTAFKTSHGAPAWRVGSQSGGKLFAILWERSHGEASTAVLVKCSGDEEMAHLIDAEPDLYFRPPYYGPSGWIGLRLDRPGTDWDHVAEWLERSWSAVAPAPSSRIKRAADEF
jgi:phosphoribosylglycinamide formyltransferase-1